MNKIILIGHLGRDPELQVTPDGTPVTKFSLAVNRYSRTNTGERKEETDWFNVTAWRQLAETCEKYLHKGSKVYIEGRLTQRKYTDRDGIQRTSIDVSMTEMEMLTPKSASTGSGGYAGNSSSDNDDPFLPDFPDDAS
ncbi:MAG TPA: single-stranded DNA-binding protein [Ktedonobacteraceae bacterium]|nr:single-stranded DNA-binding protein [Ktedonobacteraceae bacterium]